MPYVQTDLDHDVRVDLMLGIALAVHGHHIPSLLSLGGLAARRTSSSACLLYTSPSPRDQRGARMPSSA